MTEKTVASEAILRQKVEHPFHVIDKPFCHCKTPYRGLAKNTAQLFTPLVSPIWCRLVGGLRSQKPMLRPKRQKVRETLIDCAKPFVQSYEKQDLHRCSIALPETLVYAKILN